MGNFEPIRQAGGFATITARLAGTAAAGDGLECDNTAGTWTRVSGAATGLIGVAAADGVSGDDISVYIIGTFKTTNDSGGALQVGDLVGMKDHTDIDAGSTGDSTMYVVGPTAAISNAGEIHVYLHPGLAKQA